MFWCKKTMWKAKTARMTVAILLALGLGRARADYFFGEPTNLGPTVNSSASDPGPYISADGLELYFESYRPGYGQCDIWVTTRATIDNEWAEPTNLGPTVNSSFWEGGPCISADSLSLYFWLWDGQSIEADIWVTKRATKSDDWGTPAPLEPPVSSPYDEWLPGISFDGLELFFCDTVYVPRPGGVGGADLWVSTRPSVSDPWDQPRNLGPTVNSSADDRSPDVSSDGLMLFFESPRPGGQGDGDIWVARRAAADDDWGTPVNLGAPLNGPFKDSGPSISADGRTLYFTSDRPGGYGEYDLWQAPIEPVVDFNGDGKVDGKELDVMIVEFGGTDALCDIGPYAWGDGVVDFEDLKVLAEYIGKEVEDPTLIAHWPLDEAEGMTACDMAGEDEATVLGNAVWQPEGGKIGGALAFDGVDDFVLAHCPAGLGDGPFSVCAWVKGGAADEVILASGTTNWLYTNPADGSLMTALGSVAGNGQPLFSDVVITDGRWHRIGLVWDGVDRILLVDEQEVARDEQGELAIPNAGLIIGAEATVNRSFSGQIDDLRIYNRAVKP